MFCNRCLYSIHHPFGIILDDKGICSGCRIHEEKDTIDWATKNSQLLELVEKYYTSDSYDCVVPVTGNAESFYVLHKVIHELGLKPLCVHYNKYFNNEVSIRNLARLREVFGVDIIFKNVNLDKIKKISRYTFQKFGNPYYHVLLGSTVFPVQTAVNFNVPLIIWGAHQGIEQTGMFSYTQNIEMSRRYRGEHDLSSQGLEDNPPLFSDLTKSDLIDFVYPRDQDLWSIGVRGIYLNNYFRWDYRKIGEFVVQHYGYETAQHTSTFEPYENINCHVYLNTHDRLKRNKFGYSKVTDQLCREIRHGRINRDDALRINRYYQNAPDDKGTIFADWLNIPHGSYEYIVESFRSKYSTSLEPFSVEDQQCAEDFCNSFTVNHYQGEKCDKFIYFGKGM